MEAHRPRSETADHTGRPRRRRDAAPLDGAWLETEAIRHLARWESTRLGLRQILERRVAARCERTGESESDALAEIPAVLDRLIARGYLDDRRFAEQLVDRARRQGRSDRQIRARLDAKGVEADVADSVLRARDRELDLDEELEAAWKTARKRRLGPFCTDPARRTENRQRHLAVLARQGFSREIAYRVIDADAPARPEP